MSKSIIAFKKAIFFDSFNILTLISFVTNKLSLIYLFLVVPISNGNVGVIHWLSKYIAILAIDVSVSKSFFMIIISSSSIFSFNLSIQFLSNSFFEYEISLL